MPSIHSEHEIRILRQRPLIPSDGLLARRGPKISYRKNEKIQ